MRAKQIFYTCIFLFLFFFAYRANAQRTTERRRSVTITQTVVDGKVTSADTLITYSDTTTRTVNSKEVSIEMPYSKGGTVYIDDAYRKLNIKDSKDGKVRLATTVFYHGEPAFTNEQWLEKLNIKMRKADSGIVITSGSINADNTPSSWGNPDHDILLPSPPTPPVALSVTGQGSVRDGGTTVTQNGGLREVTINNGSLKGTKVTQFGALRQTTTNGQVFSSEPGPATVRGWSSSSMHSTAVFDEKGNVSYNSSSLRREITLYIPKDAKLDIITKYADVSIDHDLADLKTSISNASIDLMDVDKLNILSSYSNLSMGNVGDATMSVTNGKLFMKDASQLKLVTKYAKVEAGNVGTLKMNSVSDDYDIDEAKNISGTKTYGNLRLDKLTGSFDLKGSSADVKIRKIEPGVSTITIDNKYADVRLPVTGLENYEVLFSGSYSSVFATFDKRDTTLEKKADQVKFTGSGNTGSASSITYRGNPHTDKQDFTATVGDIKGTHTIFSITCASCNVDFK